MVKDLITTETTFEQKLKDAGCSAKTVKAVVILELFRFSAEDIGEIAAEITKILEI